MNSNRNLLQNCNLPTLTLEFDSDSVTCPNKAKSPKDFHSCNRAGLWRPPFTVLDVYEGAPVQVNVRVQKWRCTCGKEFSDPSNPYHGKNKTSKEFRMFLAQRILSDSKLREQDLASKYGLSTRIVSQALNDYMNEHKNVFAKKPICWQILLKSICYYGIERLLIFGRFQEDQPIQLLGVADTISRSEVLRYISLAPMPKSVICSAPIAERIFGTTDPYTIIEEEPYDREIERICEVVNDFQQRKFSYEQMKLRLFYQSKYRREEVREAGSEIYLPYGFNQMTLMTAYLKRKILCFKRQYFDIDAIWQDYLKGKLF